MGVHHYYLYVIPHPLSAEQAAKLKWTDEHDRGGDFWQGVQPPVSFLDALRDLIPRNTSWGPVDEYQSASEWSSDLRIWHDDARTMVEEICFRYAPVGDPLHVLEDFLDCVSEHGFFLLSRETAAVMRPETPVIVADMKTTKAFRFLSDPEGVVVKASVTPRETLKSED